MSPRRRAGRPGGSGEGRHGSLAGRRAALLAAVALVILVAVAAMVMAGPAAARTRITDLSDRVDLAPLAAQPFPLAGVAALHLAADASQAEKAAAAVLARALQERFGRAPATREEMATATAPTIVLGRKLATLAGLVSAAEFAALPTEGFVIKIGGNRAVISGADAPGTVFGIFAFLRHAGWRSVPAPDGKHVEAFIAGAPDVLAPLATAAAPFFERRDGGRFTDGRYGETLRQFMLGTLTFTRDDPLFKGRGHLYWGHSAGYLLPLPLYRDSQPEFFAKDRTGQPIPLNTPANRVMVCPCSEEAVRVSAERLKAWIARQPEARWFAVTDGDDWGYCPQCAASDPSPQSSTDRVLRWLNALATDAGQRYADKTFYTFAYQQSVAPPLATDRLASNALVMYCPWFWTSRASAAVSFDHPLNVVAMDELIGWLQKFPEQIGVYDYAGESQFGFNHKIKSLAKLGVRWLYINELIDPFTDFMATRLRYDPFLDVEDLEDEYIELSYGSAAPLVARYLRLKAATIERRSRVSLRFFEDAAFVAEARALGERLARHADSATGWQKVRILEAAIDAQASLLRATPAAERDPAAFAADLDRYLALARTYLAAALAPLPADGRDKQARRLTRDLRQTLIRLGAAVPDPEASEATADDRLEALARARDALIATARRQSLRQAALRAQVPVGLDFPGTADEARAWRTATTLAGGSPAARAGTVRSATGEDRPAVLIAAPMTRLPLVEHGSRALHGGRFHAERVFDKPLDLGQRRFVDIHLAVSTPVPITIYLESQFPVKSSLVLPAGEQIVRIDLATMKGRDPQYPDLPPVSGPLRRLAFDLWPQDALFPHPAAKDVELAVFGLRASDEMPRPEGLPYAGQAIWLTQFRANTGFATALAALNAAISEQRGRGVGGVPFFAAFSAPAQTEAFRTFTEHRLLAPITAIHIAGEADAAAARALQQRLAAMFGVTLPVSAAPPSAADAANAIFVGRAAALAAGAITAEDLSFVGDEGFVIRARGNRVALAGNGDALFAVAHYLEDHGARFAIPDRREWLPDLRGGFLHELVVLDWPQFAQRALPCGPLLTAQRPAHAWPEPIHADGAAIAESRRLAAAIKSAARRGQRTLPDLAAASVSPLTCYVAAKLLWDPFADPSRLIRDFQAASGHAPRA